MTPNEKPAMTEFSTETAASSRVPTWPAKVWVIAPREYWHIEVKIAGPTRNQSFLDSTLNSLQKSLKLFMGPISPASPVCDAKIDGEDDDDDLLKRSGSLGLPMILLSPSCSLTKVREREREREREKGSGF